MSLKTRLGRVEDALPPAEEAATAAEERWAAALLDALQDVLDHMPPHRAEAVIAELNAASDDPPPSWSPEWSPITRRALALAHSTAPSAPEFEHQLEGCYCAQHYRQPFPLALPEAVCALLERDPETQFSYFSCERCGYFPGEMSITRWVEVRQGRYPPPNRGYFERCPLCDGPTTWSGYLVKIHREAGVA